MSRMGTVRQQSRTVIAYFSARYRGRWDWQLRSLPSSPAPSFARRSRLPLHSSLLCTFAAQLPRLGFGRDAQSSVLRSAHLPNTWTGLVASHLCHENRWEAHYVPFLLAFDQSERCATRMGVAPQPAVVDHPQSLSLAFAPVLCFCGASRQAPRQLHVQILSWRVREIPSAIYQRIHELRLGIESLQRCQLVWQSTAGAS